MISESQNWQSIGFAVYIAHSHFRNSCNDFADNFYFIWSSSSQIRCASKSKYVENPARSFPHWARVFGRAWVASSGSRVIEFFPNLWAFEPKKQRARALNPTQTRARLEISGDLTALVISTSIAISISLIYI